MSVRISVDLRAALRAVSTRVRVQRALQAASLCGAIAIAAVTFAALITRFGYTFSPLLIATVALGLPCLGALIGALKPVAELSVARALDRSLATPDLLSSAVAFSTLPEAQQSPFMRACVVQAEAVSASLSQQQVASAAPWQLPRAVPALCGLLLVMLTLTRREAVAPPVALAARVSRPPIVHTDTLAAFAHEAQETLSAPSLDPEAREVARALNALVQALADGEIDRAEALAELRKLEARLEAALAEDPKALQDALEKLARSLAGNPDAKPLQEAITKDWPEAPAAAERLAERLSQPMTERASERLAASLKKAASQSTAQEKSEALEAAKRELERLTREQAQSESSGLKRKDQQERQDRLLRKKQRELDQLDREHKKGEQADRSLERLKRELDEAAQALEQRDENAAAQNMRDAAQAMRDAAQQQSARSEAERLAEQLAQLRAELAQKGRQGDASQDGQQSSGSQQLSLERFRQLAAGRAGDQTGAGDKQGGAPGSQPGSQQSAQPGSQQSAQKMPGSQGSQEGLTPSGVQGERVGTIAMPGQDGSASGANAGTQPGAPGQSAEGATSGSEAGVNGKPGTGPATASNGQHVDTRVTGEKRGGPTRSEIILESGQRGFATEDYARVHGDYARHAESVLEQEHIPGGYRFYVRRYFQMIRPRAQTPSTNTP